MKTTAKKVSLAILFALLSNPVSADEPAPQKPARKPVKLPGMVIDFEKRRIDLQAAICLDEGFLELIACTKGSKEHESVVSIDARPMHIHTALLLLGANSGHPAIRRPVDEQKSRWAVVPPRGGSVDVYLVFENSDGEMRERPISDFISRSADRPDESGTDKDGGKYNAKFPHTFLFAGSQLRDNGRGSRQYLADLSGHVISIVTFGDELLCLPGIQSQANGALLWQIDPRRLPKVGTKVTLRLRPKKNQTTGANK